MQISIPSSQHENQTEQVKKSQSLTTNLGGDKKQNMEPQNIVESNLKDGKPKSVNIFNQTGQQRKSFNIFTQKIEGGQKKNIFEGQQKSVNLFNISTVPQTGNANIFKSGSKPLVKTLQDDENQKQSSNASSSQVMKAQSEFKSKPIELVMKFNYENPWTVVKTFNLRKFKSGNNASKEFIYLTFEKHSQGSDRLHLFVRTRQTKVLVFQGFLMKGISQKIINFMNKQQNLKITVIKQNQKPKEDDKTSALAREQLKIQFESASDANQFKDFVTKQLNNDQTEKAKEFNYPETQKQEQHQI